MDLRKVYYETEDAFDSSRTINRIFRIYFDSINKANFVDNLRDTEKEDELGFPKEDLGRFMDANNATHFILFNKWMNDIRRISGLSVDEKNQFYQDVSRASYDIESRESDDPVLNTFRVKTAFNKIVNICNHYRDWLTQETKQLIASLETHKRTKFWDIATFIELARRYDVIVPEIIPVYRRFVDEYCFAAMSELIKHIETNRLNGKRKAMYGDVIWSYIKDYCIGDS